jgi:hypothetical protein
MTLSDHIIGDNGAYNWKRAHRVIAAADGRLPLYDVQPLDDLEKCVYNLVKWEYEGKNKNHQEYPTNNHQMAGH